MAARSEQRSLPTGRLCARGHAQALKEPADIILVAQRGDLSPFLEFVLDVSFSWLMIAVSAEDRQGRTRTHLLVQFVGEVIPDSTGARDDVRPCSTQPLRPGRQRSRWSRDHRTLDTS
jgi:hypothetical protein